MARVDADDKALVRQGRTGCELSASHEECEGKSEGGGERRSHGGFSGMWNGQEAPPRKGKVKEDSSTLRSGRAVLRRSPDDAGDIGERMAHRQKGANEKVDGNRRLARLHERDAGLA